MNDFDQEKLDRLMDAPLSLYEKVLLKKDRRERMRQSIEDKFDWFVKDSLGDFYNYNPRNEE